MASPKGDAMMQIRYEARAVALIDCLGFRKIIEATVADGQILRSVYSMQALLSKPQRVGNPNAVDYKFCHFSDSVIASSKKEIEGIWSLLLTCRSFCHTALNHGMFMRGGVCLGPLIHQGNSVFGPALIDAYDIERCRAVYPRVVLETSLAEQLRTTEMQWAKNYFELYVEQDDDGEYFLNIFDHPTREVNTHQLLSTSEGRQHMIAFMKNLTQIIRIQLDEGESKVRPKYLWLGRKVNTYIGLLEESCSIREIEKIRLPE